MRTGPFSCLPISRQCRRRRRCWRHSQLNVVADSGTTVSAHAVSLGLIATELVINALQHAFPKDYPNARVRVSYETSGSNWQLIVSDNGVGRPVEPPPPTKGGLGTTLVNAPAEQPGAQLNIESTSKGIRGCPMRLKRGGTPFIRRCGRP
jgi:two-component sensor histidine kinase